MTYRPPQVSVNVLPNPRITNISEAARIPAIIGMGPSTITVTDEAVYRSSSGALDSLSVYPNSNIVITTIAKRAGLTYTSGSSSNSIDAITGLNGSLFVPSGTIPPQGGAIVAGYTSLANGQIQWPQDPVAVATGTVPATGSTYFVSYSYSVPTTQYNPTVFSDKNSMINQYGQEGNITGMLTIAGSIALENGSPAVVLCQVSGSLSAANYRTAIDKLRKRTDVEEIILVFPSGSLPPNIRTDTHTYLFQHTQLMNTVQKWRGMYYSVGSPWYNPEDGLSIFYDTSIGDPNTAGSFIGNAVSFSSQDVVLPAPSNVWRLDKNNNKIQLDGSYLAAAIAGVHAAQTLRSTPITGFIITGVNITADLWDDYQLNSLGGGGVLVVLNHNGVLSIRDAITTDPTSADTQEINVVSQRREVERELATQLFNTYTNKGKTIGPDTPRDIEATTRSILNNLVTQKEIYGYGVNDDPNTGETKIQAVQDPNEPRQINLSCSIKYLYPLKYINVSVSVFV